MKQSTFKNIISEEVKKYKDLLNKALKKFKIESIYDLSYYKDPAEIVAFMRYFDDLITGDVDDQDKPVYTKKNPDLHHSIDLTTGKLPGAITKNSKLKKTPKKLESRVAVQESKIKISELREIIRETILNETGGNVAGEKEIKNTKYNQMDNKKGTYKDAKKTSGNTLTGEEEIKKVKYNKLDDDEGIHKDVKNTIEDPEKEEAKKLPKDKVDEGFELDTSKFSDEDHKGVISGLEDKNIKWNEKGPTMYFDNEADLRYAQSLIGFKEGASWLDSMTLKEYPYVYESSNKRIYRKKILNIVENYIKKLNETEYQPGDEIIINTGGRDIKCKINPNTKASHGYYWKDQDSYNILFNSGRHQYISSKYIKSNKE